MQIANDKPICQRDAAWYLLQSKPHQEQRALENLRNQGFECFLPLYLRERLRRGKRETIEEPLFPRYLFIRLDSVASNWNVLRSTYGVTNIVRFGEQPARVPDAVVEAIAERQGVKAPLFQPGDQVCITDGAFAGFEGVFEQNDGDARVLILMELMAKQQRLSFPVDAVKKQR